MRLTVNNFMHIAVPMLFGSLGSVLGVAPVFWANACILAAGGIVSARARDAMPAKPQGGPLQ